MISLLVIAVITVDSPIEITAIESLLGRRGVKFVFGLLTQVRLVLLPASA